MKRALLLGLTLAAIGVIGDSASAYLKLGGPSSTGGTVTLKWRDVPVRYFVSNRDGGGVSAPQLEQAVSRAFASWNAVPLTALSSQFVGFTSAAPVLRDGMSTIGFDERSDLDRVLGSTSFLFDSVTGELVESDIFLNSTFSWSVAQGGETNRFDVESIALHEVGHLLGLGHSALGETELRSGGRRVLGAEAVMFPIAFSAGTIEGRTLKMDDMAGIADSYPNTEFRRMRGSISGTIMKAGRGVLGAHVIAFNTRTGKLVAGFSLSENGRFVIGGLEAGPHVLRVEPLDDGDIESFFDQTLDIDTNFQVKFHDRVIVVPQGGGASNVAITVIPK
jgi:hypothetical protein